MFHPSPGHPIGTRDHNSGAPSIRPTGLGDWLKASPWTSTQGHSTVRSCPHTDLTCEIGHRLPPRAGSMLQLNPVQRAMSAGLQGSP